MVMASQHLVAFLETIASERGVADNTLSAYTRDLEDFLGFLREQRCELTMVTSADITTYLHELAHGRQAPRPRRSPQPGRPQLPQIGGDIRRRHHRQLAPLLPQKAKKVLKVAGIGRKRIVGDAAFRRNRLQEGGKML